MNTNIEKEHFEAWLFAQPDEKTWDYSSNTDCLICDFLKTVKGIKDPRVGGDYWRLSTDYHTTFPFPEWLDKYFPLSGTLYDKPRLIQAKLLKQEWLKRFPEIKPTIHINQYAHVITTNA